MWAVAGAWYVQACALLSCALLLLGHGFALRVLAGTGASRGFTVLLLGGVVQPWVGALLTALGYVWLALVAIAAFAFAAWPRTVRLVEPSPVRLDRATVGAAAALGASALVLPVVLIAAEGLPWLQVVSTALAVGAVAGAAARPRA